MRPEQEGSENELKLNIIYIVIVIIRFTITTLRTAPHHTTLRYGTSYRT
jgi:hypothetical protein